jgi:hypothetical protein
VGRVDAFTIDGLDLWFHSSDHLPEHLHVKRRGAWEIRVYFLLCTDQGLVFDCKWGKGPAGTIQRRILEAVLKHRAALLVEWEQKVCRST